MTDAIRAFVALEMPDDVRRRIGELQHRLRPLLPPARWTRPAGQHLTLKFLGDSAPAVLDSLAEELASQLLVLGAVRVELREGGFFPSRRRPRVAWIGGSAAGGERAAVVVERVAGQHGFPPDGRPWTLHLTQARLDRPWPRAAVERFLDETERLDLPPFECREAVLFASRLGPGGAVYTPLARLPLQ